MLLETDKIKIGKKIKEYRKLRNLTQSQLAELVDLNEKQIYRIESGLNYPTYTTFAKLLKVLEISLTEFELSSEIRENHLLTELVHLIKNSSEIELKAYLDVFYALRKNIRNIQKTIK